MGRDHPIKRIKPLKLSNNITSVCLLKALVNFLEFLVLLTSWLMMKLSNFPLIYNFLLNHFSSALLPRRVCEKSPEVSPSRILFFFPARVIFPTKDLQVEKGFFFCLRKVSQSNKKRKSFSDIEIKYLPIEESHVPTKHSRSGSQICESVREIFPC